MLKIEKLVFSHPGQEREYSFDLTVEPGKITALVGPSGAGKSTLLDLIAGFLSPRSGSIKLNEKELVPLAPGKRPVSILFQADNLFDHLSVNANLSLGIAEKTPNRQKRINNALEQVGLPELGPRRASDLSGGQKQRIGLARTLLRHQPILLLDEPFANLDPDNAQTMRNLVCRMTRESRWHTLIASHRETDIAQWADQVYPIAP